MMCYWIFIKKKNYIHFIDKEVDSWLFMSTPWPIFSILVIYLVFVLKIGPKIMENRRPLNIKYIMMVYNFTQTIYNFYIISKVCLKLINNKYFIEKAFNIKYEKNDNIKFKVVAGNIIYGIYCIKTLYIKNLKMTNLT